MLPTQQNLNANQSARPDIDLRLIYQEKLLLMKRFA
jgi:hypothetical protein